MRGAVVAYAPLVARQLHEGLYEHIVTTSLARDLGALGERRTAVDRPLDPAEAPAVLGRHVAREVERALANIAPEERGAIVNTLLAHLVDIAPRAARDAADQAVEPPERTLVAIFGEALARAPERPVTPLGSSTLLTRGPTEPALGHELAREIGAADRVDALVAFVTVGGLRALRAALESFARRGGKLRLLTTVFSGTTQVEALDWLARLPGAEVRVSFDVQRTRLHAKAWLFSRATGLDTAYVGSANLTHTALGSGQEWMVKACAADLPHVIEKFAGTFESLWADPEFERFDADSAAMRARLTAALRREHGAPAVLRTLFELRPLPFQQEILDRLDAERRVHGRRRNLVVAATGTGKTVIAAFDYARQEGTPRLLFLAHRREILEQARTTFRHALRDGAFGELWTGTEEPARWDHVFATIQSARSVLATRGPGHYRFVVVDECHHAPADSYQALIPNLQPDVLLGLTATPDRSDGKSLLPDFDGHIAAELPLREALDRQLLVPFEYFGVADGTDLTRVRWSRSGYDLADLGNVYTGNHARVDLVVEQLARRVGRLDGVRALAFCVSVAHATFMAEALTARGVPALAVHGLTDEDVRADAPRRLRAREVNVLCTCDLYNEGVDLPFVDTLLLLRPTESATLFMQQLGRGLRHDGAKASCLVLDFVGRHRAEFRVDGVLSALTGVPRARLKKAVEDGFPFLPSGCVLDLDDEVHAEVLRALTRYSARARLDAELRELGHKEGRRVSLAEYLDATGRDLDEVYTTDGGFGALQRRAAGQPPDADADERSRRLGWLTHADEPTRLATWRRALETRSPPSSEVEARRLTMLDFQLQNRGVLHAAEAVARAVAPTEEARQEAIELMDVLLDRVALAGDRMPVPEWPLALHRHYRRREILAAIGYARAGDKRSTPQGGILKLDDERREILLVTLDKSGKSFSPTTRYRDYAISPARFHWETQSIASVDRPSGRRYLDSPRNGWSFYLFVRVDPSAPYAFVGPVAYESHTGDRPIAITFRLAHALPASLYRRFATLAQA